MVIGGRPRHTPLMRPLTTDLARGHEGPYFLWDEDCSVREFHDALAVADEAEDIG